MAGLSVVTAIVSNVISNVPAVMLLARLVPQLPDPGDAWLTLAMASTLAGNLTLVGSIANLIVLEGARRHGVEIGFWQYCKVGVPVTLPRCVRDVVAGALSRPPSRWRLPVGHSPVDGSRAAPARASTLPGPPVGERCE